MPNRKFIEKPWISPLQWHETSSSTSLHMRIEKKFVDRNFYHRSMVALSSFYCVCRLGNSISRQKHNFLHKSLLPSLFVSHIRHTPRCARLTKHSMNISYKTLRIYGEKKQACVFLGSLNFAQQRDALNSIEIIVCVGAREDSRTLYTNLSNQNYQHFWQNREIREEQCSLRLRRSAFDFFASTEKKDIVWFLTRTLNNSSSVFLFGFLRFFCVSLTWYLILQMR